MRFEKINTVNEIIAILNDFTSSLKSLKDGLIDKREYARKIVENGNLLLLKDEDWVVAFCSFYCNDLQSRTAFLSLIAVKSNVGKRGWYYVKKKYQLN